MKILIASSEAVPYVKTGGLGDVVGILPHELSIRDHTVKLVLPLYSSIERSKFQLKELIPLMNVTMGNTTLSSRVWQLETSEPYDVYFIEFNHYFSRSSIYGDNNSAYLDNGKRFAFFSKAALELTKQLDFRPDVVHANDWQTAMVCYYLKTWWGNSFFKNTASVLTIHNLGYQGQTDLSFSSFIGLNWMQVREEEFESMGGLNLLKGGIFYADQITTVSPSYAHEILSEPGGSGLSKYLKRRKKDITGILNGIDLLEWDPEIDTIIPENFSKNELSGKKVCKSKLQEKFSLPVDETIPLFAFIGRLVDQKGVSLLRDCLDTVLEWELQLVVLGNGDPYYAELFGNLPKLHQNKVGTYIGFNPDLAHLIEAGADFFIMPSLYEPCGLNQMYSMRYGTLPIVRAVGGLIDTVENLSLKRGTGTGFVFNDISGKALENTIGWALNTWYNDKELYSTMQAQAMGKDFSWGKAIIEYEMVYEKARERRTHWG
ncbi:MAG: glycogen synthase [Deltaproteobacteria bacterium]|jgi:starch synthase|nr:glycogen synthase [Deltaproteobacteria bacterium]MBT4266271.1 glycogen synthase [Deltaproteobacteria bacterium]MBT4639981.1 glycogen synthase [Deltaproteobacteria bacterium]MBT6503813.1 glycogen synthase [Deltaproteobacteria bacterium]MBT6615843.1 glycogen synthase [Deltaproteobacteria bacterium]